MKSNYTFHFVILILILNCCIIFADSKKSPQTFTDIIGTHPAPNLSDLAERSKPGVKWEKSKISFYDLLKLRDTKTPAAIPILERVMQDNLYETRIHGFAAAQALFCINSKPAHEVLKKYLYGPQHHTPLAINYTFHWEMPEPKRSALIEQYYLKNLSRDLKLQLQASPPTKIDPSQVELTLTLRNVSKEPYRIIDYGAGYSDYIYLRHFNGPFVPRLETCTRCYKMSNQWQELQPGDQRQYKINLTVKPLTDKMINPHFLPKDAKIYLYDDPYMAYYINRPGKFQVYALFEARPLHPARKEKLKFDNNWIGRAVTKPITIEIKLP